MNHEPRLQRVVVDTNVLFSALALPAASPPTKILDLARLGKIEIIISPFILGELEKNLAGKMAWDLERLAAARKKLKQFLTMLEPKSRLGIIKRVDADNRILECALDAKADALVTGNLKDLRPLGRFEGIEILTPREFLDKYFPNG
ncbi:MAG: putative toxin-antitoxin system toxin component, PIN family [Elusimicrobia bacterium]|nr:putative toxin-antitoxin system toxin component, PIN family [Candidatus Obscuribacterium magneticum]